MIQTMDHSFMRSTHSVSNNQEPQVANLEASMFGASCLKSQWAKTNNTFGDQEIQQQQ